MNKQEAIEEIKKQSTQAYDDFAIMRDTAIHIINQIDEPQKVTIPKFVAEWIEYCKSNKLTLLGAFDPVSEHGIGLADTFTGEVRKGIDWAKRNQETFARAWLDGYVVEKEKRYAVRIRNLNVENCFLAYNNFNEKWVFSERYISNDSFRITHTLKEIEEANFGWVFDCEGFEVEEVEK